MDKIFFIAVAFFILGFTACNSRYTPKATGYPALTLPQKVYLTSAVREMPYTFDIPSYAIVDKNVAYMGVDQQKTGWMNLQFPTLNATLYISYNAIQKNQLDILVRDAYNFANNHSNKASFIEDSAFEKLTPLNGKGTLLCTLDLAVQQNKLEEVKELIEACTGLWMEASTNQEFIVTGDSLRVNFNIINRTSIPVRLNRVQLDSSHYLTVPDSAKSKWYDDYLEREMREQAYFVDSTFPFFMVLIIQAPLTSFQWW